MKTSHRPPARCNLFLTAAVLCSLAAVCLGDEEDDSLDPSPTPSPSPLNQSAIPATPFRSPGLSSSGGVRQLVVSIGPNDAYPFSKEPSDMGEDNALPADTVLFEKGEATDRFSCLGGFSRHRSLSNLATERANVAVRRLGIWKASQKSSIFDNFGLGNAPEPDKDIWITDTNLKVFGADKSDVSNVLLAELESPLPSGTKLQAGREDRRESLKINYDCRSSGSATVELRFRAESSDGSSTPVCLSWKKVCVPGWNSLRVEHGESVVFENGKHQEDWVKRMSEEGTTQAVTRFAISAEGIERIRRPLVSSNQKLLSVDLAGPLTMGDRNEVSSDPTTLSVLHTCNYDGFADVTVVLEKDTLSEDDEPEHLTITFRKICGVKRFQHLEVFIKSEKFKNRTQAASKGAVLKGFGRPCRSDEKQAKRNPALREQDQEERCEKKPPVHVVDEKDLRTVLELETSRQAEEYPMFSPQADITYDNKVLRVSVLQYPSTPATATRGKAIRAKRHQTLTLKYTCYKDAESIILVTLHVLSHKSINLAWRKACVEPKVKVGKALTAPQAIMVTMFVCGLIVLIACVIFNCSGSSSREDVPKPDMKKSGYSEVALEDGRARGASADSGLELAPNVVGAQEVVYHS